MSLRAISLALLLAACTAGKDSDAPTDEPQPGALMAGVATARIPAPLGIGTVGYGPFDTPSSPSPYVGQYYPATTRIHAHPEIKVVVLSRGEGFETIFVRLDTVGVFQQMRRALVLRLQERLGRDLDDAILIGGTHTHSGPGRVVDAEGVFAVITDTFFPEFYDHFVDAMADAVVAAYDDLKPARIGTGFADDADAHSDRRCDDGRDYQVGTIPMIAVEREGQLDALVTAYAIHGTILGIDDLTLSRDAMGAIEEAIEDGFDHPVEVLTFNAWGADMAPANPPVPTQEGATWPGGYDQMDRVGVSMREAVHAGLDGLAWTDEPELDLETHRVPINRDAIGYEAGVFPYEYGGVYCSGPEDCDVSTTVPELDQNCLPFPESFPAPMQTLFTVGHIGDLSLVTFPGEPGTLLAEKLLGDIQAAWGDDRFLFMGYTQDYIGYSILEDDWWQGGYEASGAIWGPRQGEYLTARAEEAWAAWEDGGSLDDDPGPIEPFADHEYEPLAPPASPAYGTVIEEVDATYGPTDVVRWTVGGDDPWWGAPRVILEHGDGSPYLRPNGVPLDSDGYAFWVDLATDPSWHDSVAIQARAHHWTFNLPVRHVTVGTVDLPPGEYRLHAWLPRGDGDPTELTSAVFTVE